MSFLSSPAPKPGHRWREMILPAPAKGNETNEVNIRAADYKSVSVAGSFGTYGIPQVGDVVRFDPNSILDQKPRTLEFKPADDRSGPAYLNIPEFRFEQVLNHKGHNVGFSFFCRQGIQQPSGSLLRFDLRTDGEKMFVVYEQFGIVHGVMILEKVPREAK